MTLDGQLHITGSGCKRQGQVFNKNSVITTLLKSLGQKNSLTNLDPGLGRDHSKECNKETEEKFKVHDVAQWEISFQLKKKTTLLETFMTLKKHPYSQLETKRARETVLLR